MENTQQTETKSDVQILDELIDAIQDYKKTVLDNKKGIFDSYLIFLGSRKIIQKSERIMDAKYKLRTIVNQTNEHKNIYLKAIVPNDNSFKTSQGVMNLDFSMELHTVLDSADKQMLLERYALREKELNEEKEVLRQNNTQLSKEQNEEIAYKTMFYDRIKIYLK